MAAMSKADYSTCNLWNFKAMSPLHQTVESITLSRFSRYRFPTYKLNVSQESTSEIICAECRGLFYAIRPLTNIWSYFLTNLIKENKDCQLFYDKNLITAFNFRSDFKKSSIQLQLFSISSMLHLLRNLSARASPFRLHTFVQVVLKIFTHIWRPASSNHWHWHSVCIVIRLIADFYYPQIRASRLLPFSWGSPAARK